MPERPSPPSSEDSRRLVPAGADAGRGFSRRALLRSVSGIAAGVATGFGGAACAGRPPVATAPDRLRMAVPPLVPVRVSRDRVIRTVAGLRPFRPSGFRVEREDLGNGRTLIHNYGHGGGGVTLSWGTAHLAVEEMLKGGSPPARAAVIGCGAVGLATARLLQRLGVSVAIHARDLPPHTTSNIACAQWSPFSVSDARVHTDEFAGKLDRAARFAQRTFQDMVGARYGIRWLVNYPVSDAPFGGPARPQGLGDLFPDTRDLDPGTHPFPTRHARQFTTMMIEPPVYLRALTDDFLLEGGTIRIRSLESREEIATLPERTVFNCTGIGAKSLVGDDELEPIKGQLTVLLPQPEVDYITLFAGLYMMPRADGILLGGTRERGEWSLEPNREAEARILEGHRRFFEAMQPKPAVAA